MNSRKELQPFFDVDVSIISSYRREQHVQELKTAALYFKYLGFSTYPSHIQNPVKIDDDFVFFGGNLEAFENNKRRVEIEFLRLIKRAELVYVVATNGYLGRSGSVELSYALFINAPTALSQSITDFGQEVPEEIKSIIDNRQALLPIIPVKKIREFKTDDLASLPNKVTPSLASILNEEDKKTILLSIRSLVRHLEQS